MSHSLRLRPEGRYQCTACRAAWPTEAAARRSGFACPGVPLAHGLTPEHRVFPKSGDRSCASWGCEEPDAGHRHGPDPFCDDITCRHCVHACDCAVCDGTLLAPGLTVLEDIPEHELAQTPRRRNARMKSELQKKTDGFSVGDHVTAVGSDTRGHEVTRTGYLLAEPKYVTARRNGSPAMAIRLCVGARGTDPAERTTWTTLFSDAGSVTHTPEPEPGTWFHTELRHVPGVKASSHKTRILYGGKGGARSTEPSQATPVTVTYTDEGYYALWDPATDTTSAVITLATKIWWAHLPQDAGPDEPSASGEQEGAESAEPVAGA
ncbi:hypothetical protein [Streptomyces sp. MMS24-I29]|uniref:hypothetical protein n=1 Tax=Streptomyces sp. MMS24-I29 TaxID=3351480 RepID=UPI003C7DE1F3